MQKFTQRSAACWLALATLAVAATLRPLQAQKVSTVGVGEVGGDDVSLIFVGVSLGSEHYGWSPFASLQGYRVSFPSGDDEATIWTINPGIGARYRAPAYAFQARLGYAIQDAESDVPFFGGGANGITTSAQADWWGDGQFGLQGIASMNWGSEYVWSRGRATTRLFGSNGSSVHLGGELGWQGDINDSQRYRATQYGPILQYIRARNGGTFIAALGAGIRNDNNPTDDSHWYTKVELVFTP